ncbi:MAG TPA: DUF4331 domain-containing protein, partial [Actinomycetota bacterium]|nr:DUF4331 domain-containing protein [Actinomycetota bacterium]
MTAVVAASLALPALAPLMGNASSHREAPLVAADPQVDNTDVYAFVSPDAPDTVTLISNWIPFEEPAGGPNFYPFGTNVRYDIHIDNNHDAKADVTYRWVFKNHYRSRNTFLYNTGQVTSLGDENLNFYQTYDLQRVARGGRTTTLVNDAVAVPSRTGDPSMPDYAALRNEGIRSFSGGKVWAGQADDPFFLDLRVFDLLYGGDLSEVGDDTLAGFNVNSLALQIPKDEIAQGKDADTYPIVGVWSTASRAGTRVLTKGGKQMHKGKYVQVSRLGNPLVNEVVIPVGQKDKWNASAPAADGQFLPYVTDPEVPKLVEAIYGIDAPATPRNDLVAVFLTGVEGLNQPEGGTPSEQLRLNMSIEPCQKDSCEAWSRLGVIAGDVAGFPNGRRLADDVIDIALQVME